MPTQAATAVAHPNIAFVKYWGNRNQGLRLPANGSISLTLGGLQTVTEVRFEAGLQQDRVSVNDLEVDPARVSNLLDQVRQMAHFEDRAEVQSHTDFPASAGLASSAAAFAALSLAATQAAGLKLTPAQLSGLARRGSGSAARSVFGGYVELAAGPTDSECVAVQLAGPDHWELVDLIAIASAQAKPIGSSVGHALADTSPIQAARVADAPRRLEACRQAIQRRDFGALATVAELDSDLMHAVMMTSQPSIHYWLPVTVELMATVRQLREMGTEVFYSVDAGPNVHCLCLPQSEEAVLSHLEQISGVRQIRRAIPGPGTRLGTG